MGGFLVRGWVYYVRNSLGFGRGLYKEIRNLLQVSRPGEPQYYQRSATIVTARWANMITIVKLEVGALEAHHEYISHRRSALSFSLDV